MSLITVGLLVFCFIHSGAASSKTYLINTKTSGEARDQVGSDFAQKSSKAKEDDDELVDFEEYEDYADYISEG